MAPRKTNSSRDAKSKAQPQQQKTPALIEPVVVVETQRDKKSSKPQVIVTNNSSAEEILHASWEFITAFQFFKRFRGYFGLPAHLNIEELEEALINPPTTEEEASTLHQSSRETSVSSQSSNQSNGYHRHNPKLLSQFMAHIVMPLLGERQKSKIDEKSYQQYLTKLFPHYGKFSDLHITDKIKLIKEIENMYLDCKDEGFLEYRSNNSPDELRIEPLGSDRDGWTYWYFDDYRLYREIPFPNVKKNASLEDTAKFTFEIVCDTTESWQEMIRKFQLSPKTKKTELAQKINEIGLNVISKIEAREAARLRKEKNLERARLVELMPKKRSRRLEVKHDEEAKRQKLMREAMEKAEREEYQRKQKMKEAKALLEQERRDVRAAEYKLKVELSKHIADLMARGSDENTTKDLKPLGTMHRGLRTVQERLEKMRSWAKLIPLSAKVAEDDTIQFMGDSLEKVHTFVLFKCLMKTYIDTLMTMVLDDTESADELDSLYGHIMLDRHDDFNAFSLELNQALMAISNTKTRTDAVRLLADAFSPQTPVADEISSVDRLSLLPVKEEA